MSDHQETLDQTGYWGRAGAGGLFVARSTGRFLLQLRSPHVEQPGRWGTWGGAIDPGETPERALVREIGEEAGYHGGYRLTPLYRYRDGGFTFHNFLIEVPDEFEPHHSWETAGHLWTTLDELPSPLHFGFQALLPSLRARLATAVHGSVDATSVMHRLLDRFFREEKLPVPRIKVRDNLKSGWLGRTSWLRNDPGNTTIEIQRSILDDLKTVERVLAHELIHHCDFMKNPQPTRAANPHGPYFHHWAERINSVMGKDFVNERSDTSYVEDVQKEFFVLISPWKPNDPHSPLGWAWTARPSTEQRAKIAELGRDGAKLFKTKNARFLKGPKIQRYMRWAVPHDQPTQQLLKELYGSGHETTGQVSVDQLYRGRGWTKKGPDHYRRWVGRRLFEHWIKQKGDHVEVRYLADLDKQGTFTIPLGEAGSRFTL